MTSELARITASNPLVELLASAVDKLGGEGAKDVASAIETLAKLKREEAERQAEVDFNAALCDFQTRCPAVPKTRSTKETGREGNQWAIKYANLSDITAVARPIATSLGFSWTFRSQPADGQPGSTVIVCVLRHASGHKTETACTIANEAATRMNSTQRSGSTLGYGQRYALCQALGITTEDDHDGNPPPAPGSNEPLEEDQLAAIEHALERSGRSREKLCAWLGVTSTASILQRDYKSALAALQKAAKS